MATILTDERGRVLVMSPVAESLTGWSQAEAFGQPLRAVLRTEDDSTRAPAIDPVERVLATGTPVGLADHTILIARDGRERRIDDGAAPVRGAGGVPAGAVLVFCDVSERQRLAQTVEDARAFAEGIVEAVREPLAVLDAGFRVRMANQAFHRTLGGDAESTRGRTLFELGDRQWDIPRLRELLAGVLPGDGQFRDFEVDAEFEGAGRRSVLLSGGRLPPAGGRADMILLAFEDVTDRKRAGEAVSVSETRYRRLFETAQDGILLVDPETRRVFDANPFLTDLLAFARDELVGKELWEIGLFRDIGSSRTAFAELLERGYIRYEDLPLLTKDGRRIEVEFVSNVYAVGDTRVIQCNIRDITVRKRAEEELRTVHADLERRVSERTADLAASNEALRAEIARRERAEGERRELGQRLATAQEDERRRIARELHDQMGQHLTALGLGLKMVEDAAGDPSPLRDRLRGLLTLTDLIGREVHDLALELRPTALDDLGLQAALVNLTEGWSERSGVEVDFQGTGSGTARLPPLVETALYRVVQESLTNVLRHAAARQVCVVLQRTPAQASVLIEDDGRGFDPGGRVAGAAGRLGVLGMRERMALVGGTLTIESGAGRGTTVIARVPLTAEAGDG